MKQQEQSSGLSLMQNYAFVQWAMKFPALTLMVLLRRDIGYRLLNPLVLIAVFGFLAVISILASPTNDSAHPLYLLIFAGVGFSSGIAQRIRRWRDVNRGINDHSYFVGTSPFDFRWLPSFVRRNRRIARYVDPIVCAVLGFALYPFSHALSWWLVFAAFCLRGYEDQVFRRRRNADLDLTDGVIIAGQQAIVLEQHEQDQSPHHGSPGIPTGLGEDIKKHIHSPKQNSSLN